MPDIEKDLHTEYMVINMGPSHPVTHGTVKFLVTLDGETIIDLKVDIGYLHRGFEKMCESGTWQQVINHLLPGSAFAHLLEPAVEVANIHFEVDDGFSVEGYQEFDRPMGHGM